LSQFTKQELGEAPIKKKKDPNQPAPDAAISTHVFIELQGLINEINNRLKEETIYGLHI